MVTSVPAFLRTMLNHERTLCHDCQTIFSTRALCTRHECTKSYDTIEAKPKKEWTDPVTGLKTSYKPMKGQHFSEVEYVKNTEEKKTLIAGILYLDFETFPQPVNDVPTPPTPAPAATPDDGYPEEKSLN